MDEKAELYRRTGRALLGTQQHPRKFASTIHENLAKAARLGAALLAGEIDEPKFWEKMRTLGVWPARPVRDRPQAASPPPQAAEPAPAHHEPEPADPAIEPDPPSEPGDPIPMPEV